MVPEGRGDELVHQPVGSAASPANCGDAAPASARGEWRCRGSTDRPRLAGPHRQDLLRGHDHGDRVAAESSDPSGTRCSTAFRPPAVAGSGHLPISLPVGHEWVIRSGEPATLSPAPAVRTPEQAIMPCPTLGDRKPRPPAYLGRVGDSNARGSLARRLPVPGAEVGAGAGDHVVAQGRQGGSGGCRGGARQSRASAARRWASARALTSGMGT